LIILPFSYQIVDDCKSHPIAIGFMDAQRILLSHHYIKHHHEYKADGETDVFCKRGDTPSFSKFFSRLSGMSPKEYRKG
jgi:hypothetical protein